jgi:hypothetical protein
MNPATTQALATEKMNDLRALAAAERRARQPRRAGARSSRRRHVLSAVRALPGRAGASLTATAGQL